MPRTAPKIVAEEEPNIFAEALREIAGRRYAKPQKAVPRRDSSRNAPAASHRSSFYSGCVTFHAWTAVVDSHDT